MWGHPLLRASVRVEQVASRLAARTRSERGQGTVEYLGILVAVGALLIAVKTGMRGSIATRVTNQISDAIDSVKI
jgi:Flp pilus assembly pilin Flp